MKYSFLTIVLSSSALSISLFGQSLKTRGAEPPSAVTQEPASISLTVPVGTPLKVRLDRDLRIRGTGQPIHGKTIEPIYCFDRLLVPAGSEVNGKVVRIEGVSKKTRTLAAMNADFSPQHGLQIELEDVRLPDGKTLAIRALVTPGNNGVLQFVSASQSTQGMAEGKHPLKGKLAQAEAGAKGQLSELKAEILSPGKMHRLERYALTQSPYRPQYLDAGTSFNAVIPEELVFGTEELNPSTVEHVGELPQSGGVVHAWLTTPLNSATAKRGDPVEARISQPLIVEHHLYLPEGSLLKGTVSQVRAAKRFGRNGQLRISFHQVIPQRGIEQQIKSTLQGMDVAKGENLALDAEGGAQVKTSKARYFTTAVAVMLAASSSAPDSDAGRGDAAGPVGPNAANGAFGFKLVGTLIVAFARSRSLAAGLGAYGAARSIYFHFIARGRDVNYPRDMSMALALAARDRKPLKTDAAARNAFPVADPQLLLAAPAGMN